MNRKAKLKFSLLACAIGVLSANPAGANVAAEADQAGEQGAIGAEDIIVTAQRRDERLQDVPISVVALTAESISRAGATNGQDIAVVVPGLQFNRQSGNGGTPFLRGVGSSSVLPGQEGAVAIYVDDVYIAAPSTTIFEFNNIEQVEVLKGPQGTLFGRNATGGVVHVRTKKPSHTTAIDATIGYGRFQTVQGTLYATTGVADTLAVNAAVAVTDQGKGYGELLTTGEDIHYTKSFGIRGSALWEPSDDTSLLLSGDYTRRNSDAGQNAAIYPGTKSVSGKTAIGFYNSSNFPADRALIKQRGASLQINHDFDGIKLTSITSYRRASTVTRTDLDSDPNLVFINGEFLVRDKSFSQELRIASSQPSKLTWIAGLYYINYQSGYDPSVLIGLALTPFGGRKTDDTNQELKSYSGFVDASYELGSATRISGGLRYTSDNYTFDYASVNAAGVASPGTPFTAKSKFPKVTYRAVLDHHFTPDVMAYASKSRGFKSGGYNTGAPTIVVGGAVVQADPVKPEIVDAYEVGLKTSFLDKRATFNLAAYHYKYTNLQVSALTSTAQLLFFNAAAAKIKGIEAEFSARPVDRLRVGASVSLIDGNYTSFPGGPLFLPLPATCTPVPRVLGPPTGGNASCSADLRGNRTIRSPKTTFSANAAYTLPTSIGDIELAGVWYHNSGFFWDAANTLTQPSHNLVSGSLSWRSLDGHHEVRIWGRNLLNEHLSDFSSVGPLRTSYAPTAPLTYGVVYGIHF